MKRIYDLLLAIVCFLMVPGLSAQTGGAGSIRTVVIDPGHGGKDPGAVSGNAKEKDIVLDIALRLGNHIRTAFPGVKVIYTRDKDVFVPLFQRAAIANKNSADLFISIHVNAVSKGSAQGTETFILGQHRSNENLEVAKKENAVILLEDDYQTIYEGFDPNSPESYIMFELVQDEYIEQSAMLAAAVQEQFRTNARRIDRSVKQAGFLVLRQTAMPGILIETGFITHSAERSYLMSDSGRNALAISIFDAFKAYKKKIEAKSGFLVSSSREIKQETPGTTFLPKISEKKSSYYFSVQIASLSAAVETKAANFKGEQDVFMQSTGNTYRYFCGKFQSPEQARAAQKRLRSKFKGAFVVAFEDDILIPVEKAIGKM